MDVNQNNFLAQWPINENVSTRRVLVQPTPERKVKLVMPNPNGFSNKSMHKTYDPYPEPPKIKVTRQIVKHQARLERILELEKQAFQGITLLADTALKDNKSNNKK